MHPIWKTRKSFRERYLKPATDNLLVVMTLPNKLNSKLQRYIIAEDGSVLGAN